MKNLQKLGTILNKVEQQTINGGAKPCNEAIVPPCNSDGSIPENYCRCGEDFSWG